MDDSIHRSVILRPVNRRLCFLIPDMRLGILPVPKAGSTSMRHAVLKAMGKSLGKHDILSHPDLRERTLPQNARAGGVFVAGFVRNPFDRLVSVWSDKIDRSSKTTDRLSALGFTAGMSFPDFVALAAETYLHDIHLLPQTEIIATGGRLNCDFIGRYERLDQDWRRLRFMFDKLPDLPHHNASNKRDYRQHYDTNTRMLVSMMYQQDLNFLGYAF